MAIANYSIPAILRSALATGDIIYKLAGAAGVNGWARLAIGSAGQVLSIVSGVPSWRTQSRCEARVGTANNTLATFQLSSAFTFTPTALLVIAWDTTSSIMSIGFQTSSGQAMACGGAAGTWAVLAASIFGGAGGYAKDTWAVSALGTNPTFTKTGANTDTWWYCAIAFE